MVGGIHEYAGKHRFIFNKIASASYTTLSCIVNYLSNNFLAAPSFQFQIFGPTTVYEGDNISLTCQAGPSLSGKTILVKLTYTYIYQYIILISDIDLSWEDESIGEEVTRESEPYLLNSQVHGKTEKTTLAVKVHK